MILGESCPNPLLMLFLIYSAIMGLPEDFRSFLLWTLQIYPVLFPSTYRLTLFEFV